MENPDHYRPAEENEKIPGGHAKLSDISLIEKL